MANTVTAAIEIKSTEGQSSPNGGQAIDTIDDYAARIGNSSRVPIVIVDFATAHPSCDLLPNFVQDSSSH